MIYVKFVVHQSSGLTSSKSDPATKSWHYNIISADQILNSLNLETWTIKIKGPRGKQNIGYKIDSHVQKAI